MPTMGFHLLARDLRFFWFLKYAFFPLFFMPCIAWYLLSKCCRALLLATRPAINVLVPFLYGTRELRRSFLPPTMVPVCEKSGILSFLPSFLKCRLGSKTLRMWSNCRSRFISGVTFVLGKSNHSGPEVRVAAYPLLISRSIGEMGDMYGNMFNSE